MLRPLCRRRYWLVLLFVLVLLFSGQTATAATNKPPFIIDESLKSLMDNQGSSAAVPNGTRPQMRRPLKGQSGESQVQATDLYLEQHQTMRAKLNTILGPQGIITAAQRENLMQLTANTSNETAAQIIFDMDNGIPAFVKTQAFTKGSKPRTLGAMVHSENNARQFIRSNRQLMKLSDPDNELALVKSWSDHTGARHFKYQQMVGDIPIFGKQVLVHTDGSNSVYLLNGRYEPTPKTIETQTRITPTQALEAVQNHLGISDLGETSSELVVFTRADKTMVLTYKIEITLSLTEGWTYFINALNGQFEHRLTHVRNTVETASGFDLLGNSQTFNAWLTGGTYYLIDTSMPSASTPSDPVSSVQSPGNTYVLSANNGESRLYLMTSAASNGVWDASGVSAMTNVKSVYNYYYTTFGRNGLDDNNKNFMAVVHLGVNFANAFWNGTYIVFGDGDNSTFSNLAASLDITAHEIQHGITQHTANLAYENQSGALNEAYSDLFACMVDDDDWTVGEDVTIPSPGYLRNLADPSQGLSALPGTMSEYVNLPNTEEGDHGGVHVNMSIASRAGYLMADGLDDEGLGTPIGRDKTARIWYRALTTYLTAYAQFLDARTAMIQSAEDLYGAGSDEVAAVQAAWDAVGVTDGSTTDTDPKSGDPLTGDDIMIYLYPTDHTHDNPYDTSEYYNLYALMDAANGYSTANDKGPMNAATSYPRYTKPAAYTNEAGTTTIFYATKDYNLHAVHLASASGTFDASSVVMNTGDFYSIALSPDGRYFAYTTPDSSDNHIYVLDLEQDRSAAIVIEPADDTNSDSSHFNTILYADALAFDYSSKLLVFDALNCISTQDSLCSDGNGYRYWSIGYMHLANDPDDAEAVKGSLSFPFANQDPAYDIAYPAFSANTSFVLAIDVVNYSNAPVIDSMVWTVNGVTGLSQQVATPNIGTSDHAVYGVPTFWSQDDAITIQRLSDTNGSAYRVPIDANWAGPADSDYTGSGSIASLNDYAAALPVMHLPVARSVSGQITFSAASLNFSSIEVGNTATQTLTLSNTSDRDVRIVNISLSGSTAFSQNGINQLLPRDGQMAVTIRYTPASAGSHGSTLAITSDADNPTASISITASATDSSNEDGGSDSGGSSGGGGGGGGGSGCMIDTLTH